MNSYADRAGQRPRTKIAATAGSARTDLVTGPYESAQLPHHGRFRTMALINDDPALEACSIACLSIVSARSTQKLSALCEEVSESIIIIDHDAGRLRADDGTPHGMGNFFSTAFAVFKSWQGKWKTPVAFAWIIVVIVTRLWDDR